MSTGIFNDRLKRFFNAESGAFTTMTSAEVGKSTFNVKSDIRKLLIEKLGETNVRALNSTNNLAKFKVSEKTTLITTSELKLVCKYSKPPPKNEMTIYFTEKNGVPQKALQSGNVWFIYFKSDDSTPWLGIMTPSEWENAGSDSTCADFFEDESENETDNPPQYDFEFEKAIFNQVTQPKGEKRISTEKRKKPTISHNKLLRQNEAKKLKGRKGEEIVLWLEQKRLKDKGRIDLAKKVLWVAQKTDGLGYDIESFDLDKSGKEYKIFIEVKTTSEGIETPFNVSLNEVETSIEKGESYWIYRIFNLNETGKNIGYFISKGSVKKNFDLSPVAFKAKNK